MDVRLNVSFALPWSSSQWVREDSRRCVWLAIWQDCRSSSRSVPVFYVFYAVETAGSPLGTAHGIAGGSERGVV
jgi:hypothetical protein